jgi:molybdopterin/thiamine biosynthesis adenylyltransferase
VLLCGMDGLGGEVAKNIVLAGIKSLTVLDSVDVDRVNSVANFLIPSDKIGAKVNN